MEWRLEADAQSGSLGLIGIHRDDRLICDDSASPVECEMGDEFWILRDTDQD